VSVLDIVSVVALGAAVAASPFMLFGWSNSLGYPKGQRPFPLTSTLFFVVPLLVAGLCYGVSTFVAGAQLAEFLASSSDKCTVFVDGQTSPNPKEIVQVLKDMTDRPAHHSSPTRRLRVDISDPPRHIVLSLARDSDDPQEYWVFAPSRSRLSFNKDIGHIKTALFDAY
jgi:hypothetical protein